MKRLLPLISFCLTILLLPHIVRAADSHAVNTGAEVIIEEHGACSQVTNNSGKRVFVPTRTPEEWAAFRNNASSVDAAACSYGWVTGSWGSCSKTCGGGTRTRSVTCKRSDGATSGDGHCSGSKPTSSQSCNTQSCCIRQPASGWYGNSNNEWYADQTSDDDDDYYSQHLRWSGSTIWSRGGRERDREDIPSSITIGGWTYYRGSVYNEGMRTGGRFYHYRVYRKQSSCN